MPSNEVEFLFKARDQVSAALATINSALAGTEKATVAVGAASARAGKQQSELARFVREQRTEQRLQNFLFRETSQILGAVSIGLTLWGQSTSNASEATKKLNTALNQGFIAFQGVSFVLARANPIIAVTASALVGLAVVFGTMANDAEGAMKRMEKSVVDGLKRLRGATEEQLRAQVALINVQLDRLRERQEEGLIEVKVKRGSGEHEFEELQKVAKDPVLQKAREEIIQSLERQLELIKDKLPSALELFNREQKLINESLREQARLLEIARITTERLAKAKAPGEYGLVMVSKPKEAQQLDGVREGEVGLNIIKNLQDHIVDNFEAMGSAAEQVADTISNTMTNAAEIMAGVMMGSIERIDEAFKALIQSMIAELIKIGLLKFFTAIVTLGASSPIGPRLADGSFKTTPGKVPTEGGVTININTTSEAKTTTVSERKRAMKLIEDAIFSEK